MTRAGPWAKWEIPGKELSLIKSHQPADSPFESCLFEQLERWGSRRPLLITTRQALRLRIQSLLSSFPAATEPLHIPFSVPYPTYEDVEKPLRKALRFAPDCIVAIGGGTVLDLAKVLRAGLASGGDLEIFSNLPEPTTFEWLPMVAIPTTAGSGSESTPFAVLYRGTTKTSLQHPGLLPDRVLLDSSLLADLPRSIRMSAGLDALAQAIESCWSVSATEKSRALAHESIQIARDHLLPAVEGRQISLKAMQQAAFLSGQAIATSRTTLAHALSYGLTTECGTPHGLAVFLMLPRVVRFNQRLDVNDCQDPDGPEAVQARIAEIERLLGGPSPSPLDQQLERILLHCDISPDLKDHGVGGSPSRERIVTGALRSGRTTTNPREARPDQLIECLAEPPTTHPTREVLR